MALLELSKFRLIADKSSDGQNVAENEVTSIKIEKRISKTENEVTEKNSPRKLENDEDEGEIGRWLFVNRLQVVRRQTNGPETI